MTKDIDAIINEVAKNGIDNSYQSLMDTMLTISNKYLDK